MADQPLREKLKGLLQLKPDTKDVLRNRENSQLEFKETFGLGSRAKYAKTLAAFANNRGGYIVFGVTNEPHRIKGLNTANFDSCDPAKLTEFFNSHFSPELAWEMDSIQFHGFTLGYIYAYEAQDKPVVAIANNGSDLHEAAIYYRYRGQSSAIKFPELRTLLDERITRERRAWIQHLTSIGRAGPTNVGIIDTVRGKLFGGGAPFLIDESLLRQLKFVRAGQFAESEGAPTLRLVGDLQPVTGMIAEKPIHVGIHSEDLITSFLAQRTLEPAQAATYLRESVFQSTQFVPVHYFLHASGLADEQAKSMLKECKGAMTNTRAKVLQRLFGDHRLGAMSVVDPIPTFPEDVTTELFMQELTTAPTARAERSLLLAGLQRDPRLIDAASPFLNVPRLSEAITHLSRKEIAAHKSRIFEMLLVIFEQRFNTLEPIERTYFRKAVCFCDETLFAAEQL